MRELAVYQYPLRELNAQLVLPRDLTQEEAARLAEFIRAITKLADDAA